MKLFIVECHSLQASNTLEQQYMLHLYQFKIFLMFPIIHYHHDYKVIKRWVYLLNLLSIVKELQRPEKKGLLELTISQVPDCVRIHGALAVLESKI